MKEDSDLEKKIDKKNISKAKIVEYIMNCQITSKVELSRQLNLSMPTVINNVNELIHAGIVLETGEYESTGGRKAKSLGINPSYRYAAGIDITANHVGIVLVNLGYEIEKRKRIHLKFSTDMSYCMELAEVVNEFLDTIESTEKILGIGISFPGIINRREHIVTKSHALQIENYSLSFLQQMFSYPVYFENDANAAMLAENPQKLKNAIYLSLNHTLGGAFCIDGNLYIGQNQRAGEFGHMILVPNGRKCYCGKTGCADAYCAASVLLQNDEDSLDRFMKRLGEGEKDAEKTWEEYLDYLAILISNLRMAYDMDIILGGDVGGFLSEHMMSLGEKVLLYNGFDRDLSYLKNCSYKKEASAVGVAKHFFYEFMKQN